VLKGGMKLSNCGKIVVKVVTNIVAFNKAAKDIWKKCGGNRNDESEDVVKIVKVGKLVVK
jgi:hypothetical protein